MLRFFCIALSSSTLAVLSGCTSIPRSGPTEAQVVDQAAEIKVAHQGIQLIELDQQVTAQLLTHKRSNDFAVVFGDQINQQKKLSAGDSIEVSVWEAPPAALFGSFTARSTESANSRAIILPEHVIDTDGLVSIPFVGKVQFVGKTLSQLETEITEKLKNKANLPQVTVRIVKNASSYATVVGEVVNTTRMPITPRGERLLDAVAAAGGARQPIGKTVVQLSRSGVVQMMPLEDIIVRPSQNITLLPGDVISALYQPYSFTALGATGKNEEINFEGQGITLAQALARAGGLQDSRANAAGVFIFRFEDRQALAWSSNPQKITANGKVPVIYRLDMSNPSSFFVAQSFPVNNKDLIYISNAPVVELQKFLNVIFSITYPVLNTINAIN